jgi:hypothetical protein
VEVIVTVDVLLHCIIVVVPEGKLTVEVTVRLIVAAAT